MAETGLLLPLPPPRGGEPMWGGVDVHAAVRLAAAPPPPPEASLLADSPPLESPRDWRERAPSEARFKRAVDANALLLLQGPPPAAATWRRLDDDWGKVADNSDA